jgi:hypothetical protein
VNIPSPLIAGLNKIAAFFLSHPVFSAALFLFALLLFFHWIRRVIAFLVTTFIIVLAVFVAWQWMKKEGIQPPKFVQEWVKKLSPDPLEKRK